MVALSGLPLCNHWHGTYWETAGAGGGTCNSNGFVELTGFASDEDLQANLAAADICVDPDLPVR